MKIVLDTIRTAQRGEAESMSKLTESVNKRVFTYIYRLTVDYHLSQDLAQETVLYLIKSLPHLEFEHVNFFWSWVYRTALGKVQHHFRTQGNKRVQHKTIVDSDKLKRCLSDFDSCIGVDVMIKQEMRKAVVEAMQSLKIRYRNVLTLRCYENLSYSEIAAISGGSELQARLLFLRAKRSLRSQLAMRGFKREQLLSVLGIFGIITAGITDNAAAATTVSAASLATASTTTIFGVTVSKITATAIIGVISLSTVTIVGVREYNRFKKPLNVPWNRYVNPEPHPFGDLLYLLEMDDFSSPTKVTAFSDPDGDEFRAVDTSLPRPRPFIATPEQVLIGDPNGNLCMFLPGNHWVEVSFEGPIINGPGPDFFYAGWNCRTVQVILVGERGQQFMLPVLNCLPDCPRRCFCYQIAPFDMGEYQLSFRPIRIRLLGIYGRSPFAGFQLSQVRARIAKTRSRNPQIANNN